MRLASSIEIMLLVLCAFGGGVLVAYLGWLESGEPFDDRKFFASVGRAIVAGVVTAFLFQGVEAVDLWTYLTAFLLGAGVDVLGHRATRVYQGPK